MAKKKIVALFSMALLAELVVAGATGLYIAQDEAKLMVDGGFAEVNPTLIDAEGRIAARATEAGIAKVNAAGEATLPKAEKSAFKIESGIPVPAVVGRGRSGTIYPFDALQVGETFFVPATEKLPEPAKSLPSTISSANARFAVVNPSGATRTNRKGVTVPVTTQERKFIMRSVEENGVKGARIWREL